MGEEQFGHIPIQIVGKQYRMPAEKLAGIIITCKFLPALTVPDRELDIFGNHLGSRRQVYPPLQIHKAAECVNSVAVDYFCFLDVWVLEFLPPDFWEFFGFCEPFFLGSRAAAVEVEVTSEISAGLLFLFLIISSFVDTSSNWKTTSKERDSEPAPLVDRAKSEDAG